jgi:hypothetical protein
MNFKIFPCQQKLTNVISSEACTIKIIMLFLS